MIATAENEHMLVFDHLVELAAEGIGNPQKHVVHAHIFWVVIC